MARTTTRRRIARRALAAAAAALALPAGAAAAATPQTTRISNAPGGASAAEDASQGALLSGDGRIVAFTSWASDLVPGDTNETGDVFVHDRITGATQRINVSSDGTQPAPPPNQGQGPSSLSALSADGRYVAFETGMALVPEDTNRTDDVYVRDLRTGVTSRVSVGADGHQGDRVSGGGSLSADGRVVVFWSAARNLVPGDTNKLADVFVHDRRTGRTRLVSAGVGGRPADNASLGGVVSANGRVVVFGSSASNLVKGDTNGSVDVFARDLRRNRTTRVSVSSAEHQAAAPDVVRPRFTDAGEAPAISADGRFVAFASGAPNLVKGDRNRDWDVFLRDRRRGTTTRVSVSRTGGDALHRPVQGEPDGRDPSSAPSISANGRYVAFHSDAFNLTRRDPNPWTDVFVRDRRTHTTTRVPSGSEAVELPALSGDGRWVAFDSEADDLLPGDDNATFDVFVRGPLR